MAQSVTTVVLEPAAQEVVAQTANPPFLFELPPYEGRAKLDQLQSGNVVKPDVDVRDVIVSGGPSGQVQVRIVRPMSVRTGDGRLGDRLREAAEELVRPRDGRDRAMPVILYLHGAGWVFGGAQTHDRLIRELAVRTDAAVVFPEYSRSPEARFPMALEECYAVAQWVAEQAVTEGLDGSRIAIAGDSVGGNMATVLAMMSNQRGGPRFVQQVLFYPVTDANFDTGSYRQFAQGYYLGRELMMWFWDQYLPDAARRSDPMASPLQAPLDQLRGLPPALIITGEADVLRDEGEAYAAKLRQAGVPVTEVRYQGIIHDFVMLDALANTNAARAATAQAAMMLREALHRD
ncbi:alpha/beta hydrolase [Micromonospora sp. NPDC049679]|uniref:alpha/beta hydrolase n=1 Tax=Micromonospora sp. NPDC049679 TaxID=3155920 RepID=UPI00340CBE74